MRITWIFGVAGEREIADTTCSITTGTGNPSALVGVLDPATLTGLATAMRDLLAAGHGLEWADYSSLVRMKVAALDTAGHYLTDPVTHDYSPGTYIGYSVAHVYPQLSAVLSLKASTDLGKGKRGRMFLPHTILQLDSGKARASTSIAGQVSAYGATFVAAVRTWAQANLDSGADVVIASESGAGSFHGVTRVAVGKVTDTQRRRRRQLAEEPVVTSV